MMTQSNESNPVRLALVGMDLVWAGGDGLEDYERVMFDGALPAWVADGAQGAQRDALVVDWLVKAVQRAWQDAASETAAASRSDSLPGDGQAGAGLDKVCVLYALDGISPASRSRELHFGQETSWIDLSGENNPLPAALERAQMLLNHSNGAGAAADMVIVAMAACPGEQPGAPLAAEPVGMGFDREVHTWWPGVAAGALVLMLPERALREGRQVYANLLGMAAAPGRSDAAQSAGTITSGIPVAPALDDVRGCCRAALAQAAAEPAEIGYLEMSACGLDSVDGAEIAGVCQTYRPAASAAAAAAQPPVLTCAFGSAQANLGYLAGAGGLFGVLRAALCLHGRILPAVPGWSAPKLPALWRNTPFFAPVQSGPWFARKDGRGRLAALNAIGRNGSFAHLVLGEGTGRLVNGSRPAERAGRALQRGGFLLFPLAGDDLPGLLEELNDLRAALTYSTDLLALASEWHAAEQDHPHGAYGVAIVGHSAEELLREVDLAIKALPAAVEKQSEWQTPLGSCFSGSPVGRAGQVAFVYPGAFNSYPWAGKDLFRLFPWLHQRSLARTVDMGHVLRERLLYPRGLAAPSKEEQAAQEARLLNDPVAMLTTGSSLAILLTTVLQEGFAIQPGAAFGYSLGENSMLFASGVWQEGDAAAATLQASPLFHNRLAGPQNAIREAWGLPAVEQASGEPLWNNFLVMAPVDAVRAQVALEKRVYITHINTPRQVVIGGDPAACQRVVAALRSPALQAPFDYALHCAAMASEHAALEKLHDWPLELAPPTRLYTAATYQPLQIEPLASQRQAVAEQVARMLCSPLDFPRLVRQVYDDGARVFIEVGAGGNCARWVSESLKGDPHLALSANRRGTDDYHNLVRLLAKLHSHRVPMDLSPLYQPNAPRLSMTQAQGYSTVAWQQP